jgi:hypothetical protein
MRRKLCRTWQWNRGAKAVGIVAVQLLRNAVDDDIIYIALRIMIYD